MKGHIITHNQKLVCEIHVQRDGSYMTTIDFRPKLPPDVDKHQVALTIAQKVAVILAGKIKRALRPEAFMNAAAEELAHVNSRGNGDDLQDQGPDRIPQPQAVSEEPAAAIRQDNGLSAQSDR